MTGMTDGSRTTFYVDSYDDIVYAAPTTFGPPESGNVLHINMRDFYSAYVTPDNIDWVIIDAPQLLGFSVYTGARLIDGSDGDDAILKFSGNYGAKISGNGGNDKIQGGGFDDTLIGGVGNDTLLGSAGNDILVGGLGNDSLNGGIGNDTYVIDSGDLNDVIQDKSSAGNAGIDTIMSTVGVDLSKYLYVENVALVGAGDVDAVGDSADNYLIGNAGLNVLRGGLGNDTLAAQGSGDSLYGGEGSDLLLASFGGGLLAGDAGNDKLVFGSGAYLMQGGSGNDTLVGGADADTLDGGGDDDLYAVNSDLNLVRENALAGTDTIQFALNFSTLATLVLPTNVERGIITGAAAFNLDGNDASNYLEGNAAANSLSGLVGDDTILGGLGDDVLNGGDGNDSLLGGAGQDSISGDLSNDILYGEDGSDLLSGGAGNDILFGGSGADTLRGGLGADVMSGEQGNDLYLLAKGDGSDVIFDNDASANNVDVVVWSDLASTEVVSMVEDLAGGLLITNSVGDVLTVRNHFSAGGFGQIEQFKFSDGVTWSVADIQAKVSLVGTDGNDAIYAPTDVANRILGYGGTDAIYGGALNDTISGGAGNDSINGLAGNDSLSGDDGNDFLQGDLGNDVLNGGTGDDTLQGGVGNDQYVIDSVNDRVVEKVGEGRDTLRGNLSFTVADNVEVASLLGTGNFNLTGQANLSTQLLGNAGDNLITGGSAGDVLFGGAGRDTLVGGNGSDIYQLADDADTIIEDVNGIGVDAIVSLLANTTMAENVEYLQMTGFGETVTGSSGDNVIFGNNNGVWVDGKAGDDQIFGGSGFDTLIGGLGEDTLTGGTSSDLYRFDRGDGFDTVVDTDATVGNQDSLVLGAINSNQLWLSKAGNDLAIQVIGTTDGVLISNWYSGSANQIEVISAGGQNLTNDRVQGLVQAMSSLTPPPQGQLNLSASQQSALSGALAQAWR